MNKKEISEIRRHFTPNNCTATRICSCYVDHEKKKKFESREAFLSLPEEEEFKYFDIFKKTLGGSLGKQLVNLEFPLAQELEGGTQEFLYRLRNTGLQDDDLVTEFFDKIIENFDYGENYYIILTHSVYDVPGKTSDNLDLDDASEEVYTYLLCSICPVKMAKPCLSYNAENNCMEDHIRDWLVEMPVTGFLFPAFNDRSTDLHSMLYFKKKPEDMQENLVEKLFGAAEPPTPQTQQDSFLTVLEKTLGEEADFETVAEVYDTITSLVEESKEAPEPLTFTQPELHRILEDVGLEEEQLAVFDENYDVTIGNQTPLQAVNIVNTKKFEVKTPHIRISVDPDCSAQVETRLIDGRQCLVIAVDDHVEINGLEVKTLNHSFKENLRADLSED